MSMDQWTGKCACGALRWRATASPTLQGFCHCKSCQRTSGSGHVGFLCFPESTIAIEGERRADHAGAQAEHVHVVVLDALV